MSNLAVPFNISLLNLTPDRLVGLKPVTSLDVFEGATKDFHESGLFSVSIFGKVGDERRNERFSYIDIKASIFHPVIYRALVQLKRLYGDILAGSAFAVWNEQAKDFEKSTILEGQTGFEFFRKHWKDIKFEDRPSDMRELNIKLIEKFKDRAMMAKVVVMPAGRRDFEIEENGKQAEDEINKFYRKILSLSNSISLSALENAPEMLNSISYFLQINFNQIYDMLENSIQGKKKLLLGKWASRRIQNGTRNVISAVNPDSNELGHPGNMHANSTQIGMYQLLKAMMPVSKYSLRNGFLAKVFTGPSSPANLVDPKTFKRVSVNVNPRLHDAWMSDEGLDKVITSFSEEVVRHKALEIAGHYLGLIYKGPDKTYKLMQDIDELPEGRSKDDVSPLTFCELLYLSIYKKANSYPLFVTRYPITGMGSIYPSKVFLKPTIVVEERAELDDNWEPVGEGSVAYQFPVRTSGFVSTISPSSTHLGRLGADFDGDTVSANVLYMDESVEEVDRLLNSKKYYVGTDGRINFSSNTDTVAFMMKNMTGVPIGSA